MFLVTHSMSASKTSAQSGQGTEEAVILVLAAQVDYNLKGGVHIGFLGNALFRVLIL